MSLYSATEKLKRNLRASRKAILGRGGEVSDTAGLKDLPKAIFDIPADSSLAFYEDSEVAYRKIVPDKAEEFAMVKSLGGMTYKTNNYFAYPYEETTHTQHGITFTDNGDGTITVNGTATETTSFTVFRNMIPQGTYTLSGCPSGYAESIRIQISFYYGDIVLARTKSDYGNGVTFDTTSYSYDRVMATIAITAGTVCNNLVFKPMLNKGTTALPFEPYFEGLRNTKTTKLVSEGASGTLGTLAIPSAVQALDGYGWGVNAEHNNHIEWRDGRVFFVKMVDRVDLGLLTWGYTEGEKFFYATLTGRAGRNNLLCVPYTPATDGTSFRAGDKVMYASATYVAEAINIRDLSYTDVETFTTAMQGVMLYYALATPIETDITHLFTEDNFLKVEGGGSVVAVNEYEYAVPSEIAYVKQVDESGGGEGDAYEIGYETGYGDGFSEGKTAITSKLTDLEVTENGEYTPSADSTGFKKVTVNVESSSGGENLLQTLIDARKSTQYLYYGTLASTVNDEVVDKTLRNLDTSNVTDMTYMFYRCINITTIPPFNTSNATKMDSMFYNCEKLLSVPQLDTSKTTSMNTMFKFCGKITTIPLFDTSNVTDMTYMCAECYALTTVPLLDTSNVMSMSYMFSYSRSLTSVPLFDTRKVTNMTYMFNNCSALTTVPSIDVRSVTSTTTMFTSCKALTEIWIKNIKASITVGSGDGTSSSHYGYLLTVDSLVHLCYELRDTGSARTLTVGTANLAKLADVYVKPIAITDEMRAEDDLIDEKLPFVRCESTDEGATLITDYVMGKNWSIK